jgi:hypothetical protein
MYGFKAKIDLPDGYSYCGPMGNVTKVNVDVGSGNNTLQTAANQCVSYYYSTLVCPSPDDAKVLMTA